MNRVNIPGRKITDREITSLNKEGKYFCGYLREPHMHFGKFTGLCALCDFNLCSHLHILSSSLENSCPVYTNTVREMEDEEKERLKKSHSSSLAEIGQSSMKSLQNYHD